MTPKLKKSPAQLQRRFHELAKNHQKKNEIVKTIDQMGEALLSLDGSEYDLDDAKDSVAIDHGGMMGFVEGVADLGLVFTMNVLDEKGGKSTEYFKDMTFLAEPDVWGDTYKVITEDKTEVVVQNDQGLLAYFATDN